LRGFIVIDLGFGDSGKGLLTDFLTRRTGAGLVVRYNGGAQAGHNVVTPDGTHHTFSQFGSGTFVPGVRTFLSRHVVLHPTALLVEREALESKGIRDAFERLRISEGARVITPYHQAANRVREIARGPGRHGSCGIGFGETVLDGLDFPEDSIHAGDLSRPHSIRPKLQRIRERKREEVAVLAGGCRDEPVLQAELGLFENPDVPEAWIASVSRLAEAGLILPDTALADWAGDAADVIFEGAQGILLDEDHGFHPYTTWSRCTAGNAEEIIAGSFPQMIPVKVGVMRSYAVRHGPGPLPTDTDTLAPALVEHNATGYWQGPVRYGWFDPVLARYGMDAVGGVDRLVVTHLDAPVRMGKWFTAREYSLRKRELLPEDWMDSSGAMIRMPVLPAASLDLRRKLTRALFDAEPVLEPCEAGEEAVLQKMELCLGRPIDAISRGPRAGDVAAFGNWDVGDRSLNSRAV
jgi:adenylosuccinate synthase